MNKKAGMYITFVIGVLLLIAGLMVLKFVEEPTGFIRVTLHMYWSGMRSFRAWHG